MVWEVPFLDNVIFWYMQNIELEGSTLFYLVFLFRNVSFYTLMNNLDKRFPRRALDNLVPH